MGDTECCAKFSELLRVWLMSEFRCTVHCAYAGNQNFIKSKFYALLHYFLYKLNICE